MQEYIIEGHALRRIAQRDIKREWVLLTIEHGTKKKNYGNSITASISKDTCQKLIDDLFAEINDIHNLYEERKDALREKFLIDNENTDIHDIDVEQFYNIQKQIDKIDDQLHEKIDPIKQRIISIKRLKDRGGIKVVYNPQTLKVITVFHKDEKITAEFRVF